jgi:hypothetical protein
VLLFASLFALLMASMSDLSASFRIAKVALKRPALSVLGKWTIAFETRLIASRSEIDNGVTTSSSHSNTRKVFRAEHLMSAGQLLLNRHFTQNPLCRSERSIKRNVKKKLLPRPEGEKICLEIQPTAL